MRKFSILVVAAVAANACRTAGGTAVPGAAPAAGGGRAAFDYVITNGRIVDGTGAAWFRGDIGIRGDRIARMAPRGTLVSAPAAQRIDANDLIVAPGFIDIQAQSYGNFMNGDGLGLSMVTQGITTAILGEGSTPAPISQRDLAEITDPAERTRATVLSGPRGFGNWLESMRARGMSQNVGSFVGAGTVRVYGKGRAMGAPSSVELDSMRLMMRNAMEDGAFGVASALIYPPNNYASTGELVEIVRAMAPYGGVYITHMRSEGDQFLEALDEAIRIGREGGVPVEVYHLKASGPRNWPKMPRAIAKIDSARAAGQDVQADMYLYIAGGNNFSSCIAPKYAADGKLLDNLRDAALRPQIKRDLMADDAGYENLCVIAGPGNVMVVGFRRPELKQHEGKRLDEIARAMGKDWGDVIIDLNIAENGQLGELLFLMSEENVKLQLRQPWIKFGTDAGAMDPARATGLTHPRAYGNFPRLLGKYVRDERVIPLEDAVRKASAAVATRLSLNDRGVLKEGMKADIVVFDEKTIRDLATFESPHQLSVGMRHVLVNGVPVVRDGEHTGAKPGQLVRGTGWTGTPRE